MAVSGIQATGTGDVTTGPTILYGLCGNMTVAGTLTLRNGGASGNKATAIDVGTGNFSFLIPFGAHFPDGLHVTYTTATGNVTFWV